MKVSKNSNGKRCKRELEISEESDGGFWKASTKETKILDYESKIIGYVRLLKFHAYKNKNRIRKEAQPTEWIMHEYRLHSDIVSFYFFFSFFNSFPTLYHDI